MGFLFKFSLFVVLVAVSFQVFKTLNKPDPLPVGGYIVLTGASSGIGLHAAEQLASIGYKVFAAVRKPQDLDKIAALAKNTSYKGELIPLLLDVTSAEHREKAFKEVSARVGSEGLRGLVNNAGVSGRMSPFEVKPVEEYEEVMTTNFLSQTKVTKVFFPLLKQAKGRVVQISSPAAHNPIPFGSSYAASKAAFDMWSRVVSRETRFSGMRFITLNVAAVQSRMVSDAYAMILQLEEEGKSWPEYYAPVVQLVSKLAAQIFDPKSPTICQPEVVSNALIEVFQSADPSANYDVAYHQPKIFTLLSEDLASWFLFKVGAIKLKF